MKGFEATFEQGALLIVSSVGVVGVARVSQTGTGVAACHSAARTKVSAPSAILPAPDSVLISSEGGELSAEAELNSLTGSGKICSYRL